MKMLRASNSKEDLVKKKVKSWRLAIRACRKFPKNVPVLCALIYDEAK